MHFLLYTGWGYGAARTERGGQVCAQVCVCMCAISCVERDLLTQYTISASNLPICVPLFFQLLMIVCENLNTFFF